MNELELTQKLREKYVGDLPKAHKERSVEDALQEALDNTTPERAGAPNQSHYAFEGDDELEWI
ncbi:hypothetical protein LCGC14_0209350 [marine sediment metagenome]|uniref:Uncharacterized protein n=1 Tax=marine sediment metagenome TaxID=412755 RepID=A0A0F9ULE5_9ZZZZ